MAAYIKMLIKVPLLLAENFIFFLFPALRPYVEKFLYNPLDFKAGHIEYTQRKYQEFQDLLPENFTLSEKTFLELGPGGSIGMGLLALLRGAKKYIGIDEGVHEFISQEKVSLYRTLLPENASYPEPYFLQKNTEWIYNPEKISIASITQDSKYPLPDASVDVLYSCAVLEHVHNLDLCFKEMTRVLGSGGIMYHEVDLRDHIFHQEKLWFLAVPKFLFAFLFSRTGAYINRARLSAYRSYAEKYGLEIVKMDVKKHYSGKLPSYTKKLSEEDARALVFACVLQKS